MQLLKIHNRTTVVPEDEAIRKYSCLLQLQYYHLCGIINSSRNIHSRQEPLTSFKPKCISYFKTEVIPNWLSIGADTSADPVSYKIYYMPVMCKRLHLVLYSVYIWLKVEFCFSIFMSRKEGTKVFHSQIVSVCMFT